MTQNNGSRYTPGYDLFKLIVAVILTIILILLLLQESRLRYAGLSLTVTASSMTKRTVLPTMTSPPLPTLPPMATATSTPLPSLTSTEPIPTQAALIESTPTEATSTQPAPTELTPTVQPPVTETPPTESIPASDPNACPANPTRLQAGNTVRVLDWLNFRTGPGLHYTIQRTNRPGTEMEVIGGPVCTLRGGDPPRAYLWWNVRMENGREGWSAEAPLNYPNYFLEPTE
ncbi:MAG: hypothetical protein IH589_01625 [Anaerolineales bacterium]|nr:hypothetical protein [Anaerolineales bacterium]